MLALLLAAAAAHHAPPATMEGRVSLLEAKQMLESQQLWSIRSEMPPDALRALADVQLHLQRDQEQDDKVRDLSATVQLLERRLAALELVLQDRGAIDAGARIPVQVPPLDLKSKSPARKPTAKKAAPKKRARFAESP